MYLFTSLVIPGYQKFFVINSVIFHCLLYSLTGVSWCNLLSFSFLGIYTFSFFNISSSSYHHCSSLNIFIPVCFISSIAFTILLSLASYFLTLFIRSTPFIITSVTLILFVSNYSFFTSICFLLSFSTPTF